MNIYIDFDGTLFDTDKFYKDFLAICNLYNVNETKVFNIRNESHDLFNLDDLALKIKDRYNLDDTFINNVNKLYNAKYLYDDVIDFLEKYYKKYNLFLLTFGEVKYQTKKIDCTNLKKYFKDIIITSDKGKENIDYQNSWFIDNNPREIEKIYNAGATRIIRIKRKDDSHFSLICNVKVKEYFAFSSIDVL